MITIENRLGSVRLSQNYFAKLIGSAVSSCYGVSSMVPQGTQKWKSKLFGKHFADTGICVSGTANSLVVDLHITVMYGLNISAVSDSIRHKVTYVVEEATGLRVKQVIVNVDRMDAE